MSRPDGDGAGQQVDLSGAGTAALAVSGAWGPAVIATTVGQLAVPAVVVPADALVSAVQAHFRRDGALRSVVVDTAVGPVLLDRPAFESLTSDRTGLRRWVHGGRRLGPVDGGATEVFRADITVSRAAAVLISATDGARTLDAVVVTWPDGSFGVAEVAVIFECLAQHYAHESLHDPLTGLPNRSHLVERLRSGGRRGTDATVFFIDLDRFKDVNDQLGHAAGDQVLTEFANRLRRLARADDLVVRLGGDEFALLAEGTMTRHARTSLAERVVAAAAVPFDVHTVESLDAAGPHEVVIGASVGIAHAERDDEGTADSQLHLLLRQSDLAMYQAKSHGRGRHAHFEPELEAASASAASAEVRVRRDVERRLRLAIDRRQLEVHYQPVVGLPSGRVIGAEALVRWFDPELGAVPPDQFIPVAEASGLVLDLGRWVLRTACREAVRWRSTPGSPEPTVAVNVSAVQLAHRSFVDDVTDALASSGLAPHRLTLEITETAAIADLEETAELLGELRTMGVRLALDDFGTGHSSLTVLRALPLHTVKVDRSFVEHVTERAGDAVLVRLVIDAAHSLGLRVCAEGIEQSDQAAQLVAMGCDEAQGWLFGRPEATSSKLREVLGGRLVVGPPLAAGAGAGLAFGGRDELVVITSPDRIVGYVSSALGPMLGWQPADVVGLSIADHFVEDDLRQILGAEQLPSLQVDGAEVHRVLHRDGSTRWLQSRTERLHDHHGEVTELLTVSRDVTAAVEAELALRESEARFRFAFDDAPTGMTICRLDGTFVRVNAAFAGMLGTTAAELAERTIAELTHLDDRATDEVITRRLREGTVGRQDVRKCYRHADGHPVPARVRITALADRDGVPTFVVAHVTPDDCAGARHSEDPAP